jgi:hypothetical protein
MSAHLARKIQENPTHPAVVKTFNPLIDIVCGIGMMRYRTDKIPDTVVVRGPHAVPVVINHDRERSRRGRQSRASAEAEIFNLCSPAVRGIAEKYDAMGDPGSPCARQLLHLHSMWQLGSYPRSRRRFGSCRSIHGLRQACQNLPHRVCTAYIGCRCPRVGPAHR